MGLISLVYVSRSKHLMSDEELKDILQVARKKNAALNVTGMLLYRDDGYFVQVLEGEESAVMNLYDAIKKDERHHYVLTVSKTDIAERSFANWSMGFNKLTHQSIANLQGFVDFMTQELNEHFVKENGTRAIELLKSFHDRVYF